MTGVGGLKRYTLVAAGIRVAGTLFLAGLALCLAADKSQEAEKFFRIPVYLAEEGRGTFPEFEAFTGTAALNIRSATPIATPRPLLLIVDPGSLDRSELLRQVAALADGLSRRAAEGHAVAPLRVGLVQLDGILSGRFADPGKMREDVTAAVSRYLEQAAPRQDSPWSSLDQIAALIRRAEAADGPLDCLILAKDRNFGEPEATALRAGAERYFFDTVSRLGSTLYGHLEQPGVLASLCRAGGGMVFPAGESVDEVLRGISTANTRGFVLELSGPAEWKTRGRFVLEVRARTAAGGSLRVRAPSAIWLEPDGNPAPAMQQVHEAYLEFSRARDVAGQGEIQAARQHLDKAFRLDRWNAEAYRLAANLALAGEDTSQARILLERAAGFSPPSHDILQAFVEMSLKAGQPTMALGIVQSLAEANPADSILYRLIGRLQVAEGRVAQAAAGLERAAAAFPENAAILYREAAELRERREEYGQALLDYEAMFGSLPEERAAQMRQTLAPHLGFLSQRLNGIGFRTVGNEPDSIASCDNPPLSLHSLPVPGGIPLLAGAVGVDTATLAAPDGLERLFSHLLNLPPSQLEGRQQAVARYLSDYEALQRHLQKKRLIAPGLAAAAGGALIFPLSGDKATLKRTRDFLSFFGVKLKEERSREGASRVILEIRQNRKSEERRELLRELGVDFAKGSLSEIRLVLSDGTLPSVLDSETLSGKILISQKHRSRPLIERLVRDPASMRLYASLAAGSDAAREKIVAACPATELARLSDLLHLFGPFLDFVDGRLDLPGMPQAWEQVLGVPQSDPRAFLSAFLLNDQGRMMSLYDQLCGAPGPVRQFFASSPEQLRLLYELMPAEKATERPQREVAAWNHALGRVLRLLQVDDEGLYLPLDGRFAEYLLPAAPARDGAGSAMKTRIGKPQLYALAALAGQSARSASRTSLDLLEFLVFLQDARPELVTDEIVAAIMSDPSPVPFYLDLIWDIPPQPERLPDYLAYCRELARGGNAGWNQNRNRTSQSLLYLIAALRREHLLGREEGQSLLEAALATFQSPEEGTFSIQVFRLLSEQLLPKLVQRKGNLPPDDILLAGLAGEPSGFRFDFDGAPMEFHPASYRLARMRGVLQLQQISPLPVMLEAYRAIQLLGSAQGSAQEVLDGIASALASLTPAPIGRNGSQGAPEMIARSDFEAMSVEIENSRSQPQRLANLQAREILANRLAALLHPELGVTLLAYCYAYAGSPEIDALAFDSTFIRKHDFSGGIAQLVPGWLPTRIRLAGASGSYLSGSLSGLAYQLSRYEKAPSGLSLRNEDVPSAGAALLNGVRAVQRPLRSDRAQEYVALSARLARSIISYSGSDDPLKEWLERCLASLIPPKRRERLMRCIAAGDPNAAADFLTPSEMLFIGRSYLADLRAAPPVAPGEIGEAERTPAPAGGAALAPNALPILDRLEAIVPGADSSDNHDFQEEILQYGIPQGRQLGLNVHSLTAPDPYERLERGAPAAVLLERICDLKIRIAEISYAQGWPAALEEPLAEQALRSSASQTDADTPEQWKSRLEWIKRLDNSDARAWMRQLLAFGTVNPRAEREENP